MIGSAVKHITFFTSCLGGGGAEKHLVRVANHLDRAQFRVSVLVARSGGAYEPELASDVDFSSLGVNRMMAAIPRLPRRVADLKPDIVCSVLDHASCALLMATRAMRKAPPVVVSVQIPPTIETARNPAVRKRLLLAAIPRLYNRAAALIALSEGVKSDLMCLRPAIRRAITVIPNAATDSSMEKLASGSPASEPPATSGPILIACGRLTRQKGYPVLLEALALVRQRIPAQLWIVGEGELWSELEAQAAKLGLSEAVWFAGFQRNPYVLMRRADLFVLSSLWEGFGNVIVEAMAVGVPVIATDCPYGPSEIIAHGLNGLLVPPNDPTALAEAVVGLLATPDARGRLVTSGRNRAEDFRAERIAAEYGRVFADVAASVSQR
jgi:glycosyltransferase involved in cell wall biosynthesis